MTKVQAQELVQALKKKFHGHVEEELVSRPGRYRFAIKSKAFANMPQLQRQDAIWKIVDKTLPREAILDISIILAFAPAELSIEAAT
jgi:stress-induced morphogen